MTTSEMKEFLLSLKESLEVEFKKSKKGLPNDFWETYSAFANTRGGDVYLGISEVDKRDIEITGVDDVDAITKMLFDCLNNKQKVSVNLLTDSNVEVIDVDGRKIIKVSVPRASRKDKPVYIKDNPKSGCFIRMHEGDYRADDASLQRMWAEKGEQSRDSMVLRHFDFNDLSIDTLKSYRHSFAVKEPEHRFNNFSDKEFLQHLGGWKRDRESGEEGLTVAGLLMFGYYTSIKDYNSHYHLDYIERESSDKASRYVDRITLDGTWSGNLYDFYLKVYRKLTTDLKIPFKLNDDQRSDSTLVHEALREALINTIAHSDFSCQKAITVVKRPDMFGFRNPGLMRIPVKRAIEGGESDCRNQIVHDMFRMVGLSERLGSGVNQIFSNWKSKHWTPPKLYEQPDSEQTILELKMQDLVDSSIVDKLQKLFGDRFGMLNELERTIMFIAASERWVNHERVMQLTTEHSREVTIALPRLERNGFLCSTGAHREKFYTLPGVKVSTADEIINGDIDATNIFEASSEYMSSSSEYKEESNEVRDSLGRRVLKNIDAPFIDSLSQLDSELLDSLLHKARLPREKSKLRADDMKKVILELCSEQYITRQVLAELVNRSSDALRQQYLTKMISDKELVYAFPHQATHEKQGYKAGIKYTYLQNSK